METNKSSNNQMSRLNLFNRDENDSLKNTSFNDTKNDSKSLGAFLEKLRNVKLRENDQENNKKLDQFKFDQLFRIDAPNNESNN